MSSTCISVGMEPNVVESWWKENNVGAFGLYKSDKTMVGCPSISVLGTSQSTSQMYGDGLVTVDHFRQGRDGTLSSLEQTLRLWICLPSHGASFTITALFTVMVYYTALLLTRELILQQIKWQQAYDLWYPLVLSCSPLPRSSWLDETMKWPFGDSIMTPDDCNACRLKAESFRLRYMHWIIVTNVWYHL